jgi:L-fuconolactonase
MIDSHVHFWNFDPIRDHWINDEMKVIQNDFLPANLRSIYHDHQISGCIAVQANQNESETEFLLSLAAQDELIKGIVGYTDLRNPALIERLTYWSSFKKVKGWRHVLQAENDEFILSKSLIDGIQLLKNYNYTYDLLCYHDQLGAIIKLVDQVPDQPFVLDHCGKPNIKSSNIKEWAESIKVLAQNQNVYCKISGLLTEADWHTWTAKEIFNCLDIVFEHFGTARLMYGSDWPVVLVSRPYSDWFNLVKRYVSNYSDKEQQQIFSGNANRFYKLDDQ